MHWRLERFAGAALLAASALLAGCETLPGWMIIQGRAQITDYRHFDEARLAASPTPRPLPQAPVSLQWPGGLDETATGAWLAERTTVALVVLRDGRVIHERYFNGYGRDSIGTSFSMAKSVVSAMVGIAIAEGRIGSVDDPVTRYLPALRKADPRFDSMTLRHLLQMRSGIAFDESYTNPFSQAARFYLSPRLKAEVEALRIERAPGSGYSYQSGDTQVLSMVVEAAVGMPFAKYVEQRLWQPMGAAYDASWSLDSRDGGIAKAFCCLNARALDYARFGQLFLDGGRVDGRQVVPAEWVTQSTAAQSLPGATDAMRRNIERAGMPREAFYAWQWRRPSVVVAGNDLRQPGRDFYAQGLRGQYVYVAPDQRTVVVRLGREDAGVNWPGWIGELLRLNP